MCCLWGQWSVMIIWQLIWMRALSRHPVRLPWYSNQCPSSNLTTQLWWNRAEQLGCPAVLLHTLFLPLADCQRQPPSHNTRAEIQRWRQRYEGIHRYRKKTQNTHVHMGWTLEVRFWSRLFNLYEISFFRLCHTHVQIQWLKSNVAENDYSTS